MRTCTCMHQASLRDLIDELRRRCQEQAERAVIKVGDCTIDPAGSFACFRGRRVRLPRRELDVLVALACAHPIGLTAADLLQLVWRQPDGDPHQARIYVYQLRRRLPGLIERLDGGHRYRIAQAERKGAVA